MTAIRHEAPSAGIQPPEPLVKLGVPLKRSEELQQIRLAMVSLNKGEVLELECQGADDFSRSAANVIQIQKELSARWVTWEVGESIFTKPHLRNRKAKTATTNQTGINLINEDSPLDTVAEPKVETNGNHPPGDASYTNGTPLKNEHVILEPAVETPVVLTPEQEKQEVLIQEFTAEKPLSVPEIDALFATALQAGLVLNEEVAQKLLANNPRSFLDILIASELRAVVRNLGKDVSLERDGIHWVEKSVEEDEDGEKPGRHEKTGGEAGPDEDLDSKVTRAMHPEFGDLNDPKNRERLEREWNPSKKPRPAFNPRYVAGQQKPPVRQKPVRTQGRARHGRTRLS